MKITLTNDLHNTSVILYSKNYKLSYQQILKARKVLCPGDCKCGNFMGVRGRQPEGLPRTPNL